MTKQSDATVQGVTNSFDFWLSQHNISTMIDITDGVKEAFGQWLTNHTQEIVQALADMLANEKRAPLRALDPSPDLGESGETD